jgi:hypothetical protein
MSEDDWAEVDSEIARVQAKLAEAGDTGAPRKSKQEERIEELRDLRGRREAMAAQGIILEDAAWADVDQEIVRLQADENERQVQEAAQKAEREEQRRKQQVKGEGLTADEREEQANQLLESVDIDELANRLYGRLRTRLRTELLVDRERAGLLADFR